MAIGELCNRDVVIVGHDEHVREAVRLMRKHHVGDVVVVDNAQARRPVGILTDRDIVIELLAAGIDLDTVAIGDAMSFELLTARESDELLDTIERMRRQGVRRMPVVNDSGALVGILTADDIIDIVAEQLQGIAGLFGRERVREELARP